MPATGTAESPGRLVAIDRVKAAAILAVVVTHAGPDRWSPALTRVDEWMRYSWTAFHVPAFLMMAGTLYRSRSPMTGATLARRLGRVLVPYAVVLAVLFATGVAPLPPPTVLPLAVITGGSYGIYYYVPVFVLCVVLGWGLSRCERPTIEFLAFLLAGYACAALAVPALGPSTFFWRIRDPLGQFWLGYFVLGWLGVPQALAGRLPFAARAATAIALVPVWVWVGFPGPPPLRIVHTVAVVSTLWTVPLSPPGVRFLSETSLAIYLVHRPFQDLIDPMVHEWPPPARIAALVAGSLAASIALCLAARAVLGRERARRWLGA